MLLGSKEQLDVGRKFVDGRTCSTGFEILNCGHEPASLKADFSYCTRPLDSLVVVDNPIGPTNHSILEFFHLNTEQV